MTTQEEAIHNVTLLKVIDEVGTRITKENNDPDAPSIQGLVCITMDESGRNNISVAGNINKSMTMGVCFEAAMLVFQQSATADVQEYVDGALAQLEKTLSRANTQ